MSVDLMIVGAAKCGTTSLLRYLGSHPAIDAQRPREMTWFVDPQLHARPFPSALYFGHARRDSGLRVGKLAGLMY
ncbi:MAG: sulfotransferase, partial [Actinobacteria bacterium]|nr:sulfotransferase [Actinomycetota bacterium]